MKRLIVRPPGIFLKFFRWYCDPKIQGYIEGDLMEAYNMRLEIWKAKSRSAIHHRRSAPLQAQWLREYAYHIDVKWWLFVLAGVLAMAIALLTISYQAITTAIANPVKSLRSE
jgi:hypothetical protein